MYLNFGEIKNLFNNRMLVEDIACGLWGVKRRLFFFLRGGLIESGNWEVKLVVYHCPRRKKRENLQTASFNLRF